MRTKLTRDFAFGKLRRGQSELEWHPLVDHLADVAAVFEELCNCRAIRRSLEAAAGRELNSRDFSRLAALVFLHDLGKANAGFQAKRWLDTERPRAWLKAGHGVEAIGLLDASNDPRCTEAQDLLMCLPVVEMLAWGSDETLGTLLRASISHHGRPLGDAPDWPNL
ncbi:MAG: CRISPR-associated endonuclease Cas3'', partial [Zoogloeaceae bacterium]|nr:CRISPR-associated endonuclease Cas3'' [Zoogloeaceae bacterium]